MQESYFFFQVERAATELAREASYPGYDSFTDENPLKNSKVDFDWENGPSESQTKSYYAAYKGSASKIYRWGVDSKLARRAADYQQALQKNSALFSMGRTEAYVKVNSSFCPSRYRQNSGMLFHARDTEVSGTTGQPDDLYGGISAGNQQHGLCEKCGSGLGHGKLS